MRHTYPCHIRVMAGQGHARHAILSACQVGVAVVAGDGIPKGFVLRSGGASERLRVCDLGLQPSADL